MVKSKLAEKEQHDHVAAKKQRFVRARETRAIDMKKRDAMFDGVINLFTCPHCGYVCRTPAGLEKHRGSKACLQKIKRSDKLKIDYSAEASTGFLKEMEKLYDDGTHRERAVLCRYNIVYIYLPVVDHELHASYIVDHIHAYTHI